jgi:succinoglycan biosynthesis protein ExoO
MLYVARCAAPNAAAVLCDYAFLAPLAPYAMAPAARSFVIMHDLMSARVADATEIGAVKIGAAEEFALLGMADGVIAIQQEEAARVRTTLPASAVIVAQHATAAVQTAQPGADDTLLFVGSNTSPNVVGLERFLLEAWPAIRAARPRAHLNVAGSVSRAFGVAPEGVDMLGVVGDLAPLYAEAGVVISPLHTGSGLKIKLIEALAVGKAVVGTTVTAQGVEDVVTDAMVIADEPARFAEACIALLADRSKRAVLAEKALACSNAHFSADASFRDFVSAIKATRT